MTFRERIEDQNKVSLSPHFIAAIEALAKHSFKPEDEVYSMWQKYCRDCQSYDQSPSLPEFIEWNKLTGYDVLAGRAVA